MVTNIKNYLTLEDNYYDADFRYNYRDTMIAQFKQIFYNKHFKIKVIVMEMILPRKELNFGFMLMIFRTKTS